MERQHLVLMGVAGSGKTTVAALLAARLGWPTAEADEFHPAANVAKMAAGTPLTDEDRWPWLHAIAAWIGAQDEAGRSSIVTCSALKRTYRDVLAAAPGRVRFVHLTGDAALIAERMSHRTGHFMPTTLLPSQFATLEPLEPDEDGVTVTVDAPPEAVADDVLRALDLIPAEHHPTKTSLDGGLHREGVPAAPGRRAPEGVPPRSTPGEAPGEPPAADAAPGLLDAGDMLEQGEPERDLWVHDAAPRGMAGLALHPRGVAVPGPSQEPGSSLRWDHRTIWLWRASRPISGDLSAPDRDTVRTMFGLISHAPRQ